MGAFEFIPANPGDKDRDGDVDALDFTAFRSCTSAPGMPYTGDCGRFDFDADTDVDLEDFGILQRCFSGEGIPADPACAD